MLELGKAGSAGYPKGELPVLRDGSPVAVLRASNWKESATAVVGDREWVFTKRKGELSGRWAARAGGRRRGCGRGRRRSGRAPGRSTSRGRPVEMQNVSMWKSTHRYLVGGRQVAGAASTGGWSPRPTLDADDALPLHQQVFLLWLELVISRRNSAAAAGGASAAVIGGTS